MPEYLSPGVYVEEVASTNKAIVGVSTSTAAFVGIVPESVDIPEENPTYDPTKPVGDKNPKFITWPFPYPQAKYDEAKKKYDDLAVAGARPPRPKATGADDLKAFRAAADEFHTASRRLGLSALADEGQPILCTSFADFRTHFGDFSTNEDQKNLVHGVYGFFNNEGSRCYVMRFKTLELLQAPTALTPLEAVDEISMVVAPGITDAVVQNNIIDHCENMHD